MKNLNLTWDSLFSKDHLPVEVLRRSPQPAYPLHTHDFSELVIIINGRGIHFTDRDEFLVSKGDTFVIQGRQAHGYKEPERLELVNIVYDPAILTIPGYDLFDIPGYHTIFTLEPEYRRNHQFKSRLHLTPSQLDHVLDRLKCIETEIGTMEPGKAFMISALFMQLVVFLSRSYLRPGSGAFPAESEMLLRFGKTLAYLRSNYMNRIGMDALVKISGMSESSLLRAFKRITGYAPSEYIVRLRIGRAASLLKLGSKTVTEISYEVGFNDSNYFSRQFRKIMNVSPTEYRAG